MAAALIGCRVVVPETRELDLLARMLEAEGAETVRCPLVAIVDAPDAAPVAAWLRRFIEDPCDDLILLTGEGLRRLHAAAACAADEERAFLRALAPVRKVTRGPKPAKALRELGLEPDLRAEEPTTAGVIAALSIHDLRGRRVGVQLYPDSSADLLEFLTAAGARPDPVLPYAYASKAVAARVVEVIDLMAEGRVHVIAFTSSPQVRRLFEVARDASREAELEAALGRTKVAAVGPVVAAELAMRGINVAITPDGAYFMKPLVRAIVKAVGDTAC